MHCIYTTKQRSKMTTTTSITDNYFKAITANSDCSEWAELYYQQQVEAEYHQWEAQQATTAPVIALYTDTKPAPAAAMEVPASSPIVEQLVKHQEAIQATLSELNMLLLNSATPELRS